MTIKFEIDDERLTALKAGKIEVRITWQNGQFVCEEVRQVKAGYDDAEARAQLGFPPRRIKR